MRFVQFDVLHVVGIQVMVDLMILMFCRCVSRDKAGVCT